jgi:hypothetical protein
MISGMTNTPMTNNRDDLRQFRWIVPVTVRIKTCGGC